MNNDDDYIYDILSKCLRISTEAARDFVHQVNEYLPYDFPPEVIYSCLLGLFVFYRTPPLVAWSVIARKKLDPGNKLPMPLLPPRIPSRKERKVWVSGIAYENRQTICDWLQIGETVLLRRELFNKYDIHAVAIENELGEKLGYLPRCEAFWTAYSLDVSGKPLEATVTNLVFVKGFVISKGVEIKYQLPLITPTLE